MLSMRGPIELNIGKGLAVTSDGFCQRLQVNYSLLSAQYTPKDLLFLMTAPPDLPEDLGGGMTTIAVQSTTTDARQIGMNIINNVVNRILLDGSSQFTYQDQVYITSVLHRLGITNTEQFMQQVRPLRTENEAVTHLTVLYQTAVRQLLERQAAGETVPQLPLPSVSSGDEATGGKVPVPQLYETIFRRLDTARLYERVHAFQRSYIEGSSVFHHNEFRLAEQLRLSNALTLSQVKNQVVQNAPMTLLHHTNRYEEGTLLPLPRDEDAALSQVAVAALLNAVDNTFVEVLNRPTYQQTPWVHLEKVIYQTAENSLARFERQRLSPALPPRREEGTASSSQAPLAHFVREFYQLQTLLPQLHVTADEALRQQPSVSAGDTLLTHLLQTQEGDSFSTQLEHLETQLSQTELTQLTQTLLRQSLVSQGEAISLPSLIQRHWITSPASTRLAGEAPPEEDAQAQSVLPGPVQLTAQRPAARNDTAAPPFHRRSGCC